MSGRTVLLVEDNEHILRANTVALKRDGYEVLTASTVAQAYLKIEEPVDVIVLDIMLPDGSGLDFCRSVRQMHRDVMILFLSALSGADNTVEGFYAGGDDYMPKPYDLRELRARIGALLKRKDPQKQMVWGDICLELVTQKALYCGKDLLLKPKEFILLSLLLEAEEACVSPQVLYEKGWGYTSNDDLRTIRVHIFHIRKKLSDCGAINVKIEHVRGEGYRILY